MTRMRTPLLKKATVLAGTLALLAGAAVPLGTAHAEDDEKLCKQYTFEKGLKFQQQSAVIDALQRQAFKVARMQLDDKLARHGSTENLAIVTDADETLVDNTPLLVRDMRNCHTYTTWDTWGHWEREGTPELIPGAKDFLTYADAQGVNIFYVSNRFGSNKPHTVDTLQELGLPQASAETVKLWSEGNPKTKRRAAIRENHEIIMLIGDSLADLDGAFEGSVAEKRAAVEENADKFGTDWIVLPNATYGDWTETELEAWDAPMKIAE
ncbi:5'-nucleotidase, lipoprotein e(P4) family [Limimonas halophila]|uniref:5'-nucleotidase, lipoprotein e(P4) family n=1 Tax=Limimonas halophila TaxID=1082479 RepID=A0A1G7TWZ5_9PROT|nr:HAD family acid phosphatase [Limimonas halophila]SDG39040.1 5'-nucleotidase, lipoprotein e(P4) family [Limimonas halophila]